MTSAQTAKTTIYYCLYTGHLIPIYDSTNFKWTTFAELTNDLTASSTGKAGPAAATTNSNYDLFVWSDSGTVRLTRGPAWTSDTGRGTGAGTTELQRINGIWTNKNAITNGPGANLGTYVGTIRTDGSSQANWQPGAIASGGTAALLGVWNAYNRVLAKGLIGDSASSWNYSSTTIRSANASATMRVSFLQGLQEDFFEGEYRAMHSATGTANAAVGVGYNATNAFTGDIGYIGLSSGVFGAGGHRVQQLGWGYLQACEQSDGGATHTFYGSDSAGSILVQTGLRYDGRF
jgi:hypothetical protein